MVTPRTEEGMVSIEKCSVIDCVCHGREGSESDFFFMYGCFFTDAHVRLPFDEFTMGVLRILNVAPHTTTSQLLGLSLVFLSAMLDVRPSSFPSIVPSFL